MTKCEVIKPLSLALLDAVPTQGRLEKATENIFGLYVIADSLWQARHREMLASIGQLLKERPVTPNECWGTGHTRWETARIVCERCRKHFGWPTSNFVPEDSLWIAFFNQHDMFDGIDTVRGIVKDLGGGDYGDEDIESLIQSREATMLDLVIACENLAKDRQVEP